MKLLAIDTSTEACSAAIYHEGEVLQRYRVAPRQHSRILLGMIEQLLADAQCRLNELDAVAFARGPGSFTGVRMAASITQGMAFAHDLPVIPISTLRTLAQGAYRNYQSQFVLAAIDARMQEVYWGYFQFENTVMQPITKEQVGSSPSLLRREGLDPLFYGVGTGWSLAKMKHDLAKICKIIDASALPQARDIAELAAHELQRGNTVSPEQALPVYLRDNVAN